MLQAGPSHSLEHWHVYVVSPVFVQVPPLRQGELSHGFVSVNDIGDKITHSFIDRQQVKETEASM